MKDKNQEEGWRKTMRKEYARKGLEWCIKEKYQEGVGKEGLGLRIEEKYQKEGWRRRIRKEDGGEELGRMLEENNQEVSWRR